MSENEGEFKRQIKAKAEFCLGDTHTPQEMKKFSSEELAIDELIINLEDIFTIVEDAKKVFPDIVGDAGDMRNCSQCEEKIKWFKKYFGEK